MKGLRTEMLKGFSYETESRSHELNIKMYFIFMSVTYLTDVDI